MEGLVAGDIVKIAAGSGVIAALLTALVGILKDRWMRQEQALREAEIDAIHLISKLDGLAVQCANNYWSFYYHWGRAREGEGDGNVSCDKPHLDIEPGMLSKIDRALACRIAWLENDIKLGSDGIRARWRAYLDTDDALEADADLVGYFGYEALLVAKELRKKYKLDYEGAQWGMPRIEEQLSECSDRSKKFFKD
ncbi:MULTISPECIES: hypothetical protein [Pseudomonas syringae group]|uniref:DUF4760 domain-containing protein n=1 Tax=Pseudomonas savastanoi TaxID=29438 RepID=A0AAW3LZN9_PSESS|nr:MULTISPECIES: hypothetical protein [Pseudomonas syringae group]AYL16385.1 hypothetical protein D9N00_19065 [Pseudomonas syringae pv. actinidiae]KTC59093.1 hypothetical protein AO287_21615 [Pseudomonas savastanoi]